MNRQYQQIVRQTLREEIARFLERFLFTFVILLGCGVIYLARIQTETFWQSLFLNIGSSLVVFVFVFWVFQYFTGRQPGSDVNLPSEYYNVLIEQPETIPNEDKGSSTRLANRRKRSRKRGNGPTYEDNDEANLN